ncbi:MAG TPA: ribose-phosphate pyrophosphokinase [Chthonomonadaceae bacterium]|nr:ribose-phosphate pyrophosphokinase [Chthonomonadaceae bacterium]
MAVEHELKFFAGPGNPALAQSVADWLGVPLGKMLYTQFPDGENYVRFEESVRGADAYIFQPTCPPADTNLVVLLEAIDALRRASTWRITPVLSYYGYARQEKKDAPREPITAKLIADIITAAGANRVMCLDLHADAIQGFFNIPVDHLTAINLFTDYYAAKMQDGLNDVVVVSPDEGRVKKVRRVVQALKAPLAVGYKHHPTHDVTEVTHLAGDVKGKTPIIVEDMITTGGSILQAVDALLEHGCNPNIHVAATHGIFARNAVERLCSRPEIAEIVVTDSVPLSPEKRDPKIKVLSVAPLFGEAIHRANNDLSITSLFD